MLTHEGDLECKRTKSFENTANQAVFTDLKTHKKRHFPDKILVQKAALPKMLFTSVSIALLAKKQNYKAEDRKI